MSLHPDVLTGTTKEPRWFSGWRYGGRPLRPRRTFSQFIQTNDIAAANLTGAIRQVSDSGPIHPGVLLEVSVSDLSINIMYQDGFNNPVAPSRLVVQDIHHLNPGVKVIVILRNPTDRLYSNYFFDMKFGRKTNGSAVNFHQSVQRSIGVYSRCLLNHTRRACDYTIFDTYNQKVCFLNFGLYATFLEDWLHYYPHLKILTLEQLKDNPVRTLTEVFKFLELPQPPQAIFDEIGSSPPKNRGPPLAPMQSKTRRLLVEFYRAHNERLAALTGDDGYLKWNL